MEALQSCSELLVAGGEVGAFGVESFALCDESIAFGVELISLLCECIALGDE